MNKLPNSASWVSPDRVTSYRERLVIPRGRLVLTCSCRLMCSPGGETVGLPRLGLVATGVRPVARPGSPARIAHQVTQRHAASRQ